MDAQKHLFDNKKMAALLIPLAIDQLLNSFMGTVDTLVVSNLGSAAISAVTLVDSINILIVQAFLHWHPGNGSLLTLFGMQKAGSCKRGSETADFYHILFVSVDRSYLSFI